MRDYRKLLRLESEKHNLINAQALLERTLIDIAFAEGTACGNFALVNRVWSQVLRRKLDVTRDLGIELGHVTDPAYR